MPKIRLTDRFVRTAAAAGRRVDYCDTNVAGLCLRVSPTGGKSWSLAYTPPGTRNRSRTGLGTYPQTSLAQARAKAVKSKAALEEGIDPNARKPNDMLQTVADLAENFFARHVRPNVRSAAAVKRRMRKNIVTTIGSPHLADLHSEDIVCAVDKVRDRDGPTEVVRTFEDVRALARWAGGRGVLDHNITDGMPTPAKLATRERVLSVDDIRQVWNGLPSARMGEGTADIVRLCLITAQRVGEVAGMRRDELDLQKALWRIRGARTKNGRSHYVPLSEIALAVISQALARAGDSPFVFPSPKGTGSITEHGITTAVRRSADRLGLEHWTVHDLRQTALTEMEALGINPLTLGHVTNHVSTTRATVMTGGLCRLQLREGETGGARRLGRSARWHSRRGGGYRAVAGVKIVPRGEGWGERICR